MQLRRLRLGPKSKAPPAVPVRPSSRAPRSPAQRRVQIESNPPPPSRLARNGCLDPPGTSPSKEDTLGTAAARSLGICRMRGSSNPGLYRVHVFGLYSFVGQNR